MSRRAKLPPSFPALVQAYFAEYLTQQRALSAQTVSYTHLTLPTSDLV